MRLLESILALAAGAAQAKDKVKVGFIGPLTGGVSANGIGGRNSADLAVRLRNADPKAKYEYEMVVYDDECKPNVAVQVATKMAAEKDIKTGRWKYRIEGSTVENRRVAVVFTFEAAPAVFITVFERTS